MAKCVIFCAGQLSDLLSPLEKDDYIIAADGGYRHTQGLGIKANAVLGDFDSLGFVPEDAKVFPVEKDDTDAILAIRHGLSLGYKEFLLYGALEGPRLDHTVANLQALAFLAQHGATGYLVGQNQIATALKDGSITFPKEAEGYLSLFCIGKDAQGVTLKNLKYPMENGNLSAAFPLGVSNQFMGKAAEISVADGTLLILFERRAYL